MFGDLCVAADIQQFADDLDGSGGVAVGTHVAGDLVDGAGAPAHPDVSTGVIDMPHGYVRDQCPQQALAVLGRGGRRLPQGRLVTGEFTQPRGLGQGRLGGDQGSRRGLGLGWRGKFRLPAAFQRAGDQPVFRLDLAEGALVAVGFIAANRTLMRWRARRRRAWVWVLPRARQRS
ncbi:hypothetical protein [Streptomyces sp. NPDC003998]